MVSLRSTGVCTENICFQELAKFYLLTLMSVARYNGYDHFEALSTAELSRICFDRRASQDPRNVPLAKNSVTWKRPVAPENGSFPMCLPTHLPTENLIRLHHIHARDITHNSVSQFFFFTFSVKTLWFSFYIFDHDSQ